MFRKESEILSVMRTLDHVHLIQAIAAYQIYGRENENYFVFPWGDGNLREFWEKESRNHGNEDIQRWALKQIHGLASAMMMLHRMPRPRVASHDAMPGLQVAGVEIVGFEADDQDQHCRHGDLKPENILWFNDNGALNNGQGILVITDVGLAKIHSEVTEVRQLRSSTQTGTWRYGPPEVDTRKLQARSRRYDIWSMGCICMEFIIWILYGYTELERFNKSIDLKFYIVDEDPEYGGGRLVAEVHPTVTKWKDYMMRMHRKCQEGTALRALVEVVTNGLLVVETEDTVPDVNSRFTAQRFFDEIDSICDRVNNGELALFKDMTSKYDDYAGPPDPFVERRTSSPKRPRSPSPARSSANALGLPRLSIRRTQTEMLHTQVSPSIDTEDNTAMW
jgi:serine/threonine protein kinase